MDSEWLLRKIFKGHQLKIYIAGPMRGYEQYNFPAFLRAEEMLRREGWDVINPARIDLDDGFDVSRDRATLTKVELERFIMRDIKLVVSSDAICMLPGWGNSDGSGVEHAVAKYCGLPVYSISKDGVLSR